MDIIATDLNNNQKWLIDFRMLDEHLFAFSELSYADREVESGEILKNIINIFKNTDKDIQDLQKKMYKYISIFYQNLSKKNRDEFQEYLQKVENKKYGIGL